MSFAEQVTQAQDGTLPGLLGLEWTRAEHGLVEGRFTVERKHMAPNGFLHAATIVALLDTACGYGAMLSRPEGAVGFTTIELKSNFLGTAREGIVIGRASLVHGGRLTQVWDAEATADGKTLALFRCTQMMLYPKGG